MQTSKNHINNTSKSTAIDHFVGTTIQMITVQYMIHITGNNALCPSLK